MLPPLLRQLSETIPKLVSELNSLNAYLSIICYIEATLQLSTNFVKKKLLFQPHAQIAPKKFVVKCGFQYVEKMLYELLYDSSIKFISVDRFSERMICCGVL